MIPIIIINFKTYEEATADNAVALANKLKPYNVIVAVQNADLHRVSQTGIKTFAQHIDPIEFGSNTGKDLAECLRANGASGVIINHSEDSVDWNTVNKAVQAAKRAGLETIVCIPEPEDVHKISSADFVAYEDPVLIGSGRAVSHEQPDKVKLFAEKCTKAIPLCGAGISTKEDVKKAMELGTKGVLAASAIVKTENPDEIIKTWLGVGCEISR
jgi:triosephosphate isomerase